MYKLRKNVLVSVLTVGCLLVGGILSNVPVANAASMPACQKPGLRLGQQDQKPGLRLGQQEQKPGRRLGQLDQKPGRRLGQLNQKQSLFQFHIISQVASILDADELTIIGELQDGKTLVEIAESYGINESTLLSKLETRLDDAIDNAVTAGTLTEAQATEMKSRLAACLTQLIEGTTNSSLSAPTDLKATVGSSSELYLDWDSVDNATAYNIYRATSSSGPYTIIDTVTTTSYTDDDLSNDTTYYYKVKAVNNSGASDYSLAVHATTSDELSVPSDFTATAKSSSEIYLDWDPVEDATAYYIYRATSSSGTYTKVHAVTGTSYTDDHLSDGTTYYYKVKASNSSGTSDYSPVVHATTKD